MERWKQYKCGENGISYDHSILNTPFGRFLITWKSWKEYPSFDVDEWPFADIPTIHEASLEAAQEGCERLYIEAINEAAQKGYF